ALALRSDYVEIQLDLAEVYAAQGKWQEALPLFSKSIGHAESDPDAYLLYGQALAETGAYREAEAPLRKAAELDSKNPVPHLELAKALTAIGAKQEARRELEAAAKLQQNKAESKPESDGT